MILIETIEIEITNGSRKHFESLGYDFPKFPAKYNKNKLVSPRGTKITVKIEHLPITSCLDIPYKCDYCNLIDTKKYKDIITGRKIVQKDCCAKCQPTKTKEVNYIRIGVESFMQLDSTKDKAKETNLKRYGVESPMQNKEIQEKSKATLMQNYGVEIPMQSEEIKNKTAATNIIKYGNKSPVQNEYVKSKMLATMRKNHGVDYAQQSKKIREKTIQRMYENGNAPCSTQQKYIHNLIDGELNFPQNGTWLDIAFPDEKIYVEYDGRGHDLSVQLDQVARKEFDNKERRRWYALYSKGWREIRIISTKDKLPSDEKILEMMDFAKGYLNTGRHYIKFKIDEGIVKTSQFETTYDFGKLRKIKNNDIEPTDNAI
jgi:hypothetical protein